MKILITTGIFPPDSGGPATYSVQLADELIRRGHEVKIITFSNSENYGFDSRYKFDLIRVLREGKIKNFFKIKKILEREIPNYDLVYTLDWFTIGFPLSLVCKRLNKKFIVRVGGGYIWEKYLRQGKDPVTLKEFYEKNFYKKYPVMFQMIRYVFNRANFVVFNSEIQKEIFDIYYDLKSSGVIWNPMPEPISEIERSDIKNEIVFAGRLIAMKNIEALIEGYKKSGIKDKLIIIGDGPSMGKLQKLSFDSEIEFLPSVNREDLYRRIINSKVVVIPSWTDVSPNQVYELLSMKIPFLLTKENYLPIYKQIPLMIDPKDSNDIAEKLRYIQDDRNYRNFLEDLSQINYKKSWSNVTDEHEKLFSSML